ncbi:guanylate cyclase [Amylibacter marinus]|uniref:Guanylate cyclase n=1 Tax=Amylibacter marinus TaxID=1475483 RepID=A0ABQ5VYU9_9RHOB|nr:heme NO-binding domain-containing protein [Amylibacter marinus]GLQ36319.1 guanylate cyclase [Amylibacter marinus]
MKGVVFVELIAMAESIAGEELVDEIIDSCDLESGGAFTAVGNYPCGELMTLVQAFGQALNAPVEDLQSKFGQWMFTKFIDGYPMFFAGKNDAFTMLESIENEVHVEVRKLYPEAELPSFKTERISDSELMMIYSSERPLVAFCLGMIQACVDHFGTPATITHKDRTENGKYYSDFNIVMAQ